MRSLLFIVTSLISPLLIHSCSSNVEPVERSVEKVKAPWVNAVQNEVAALGAKNWILVTERAFPTPKDQGVHVLLADAPLPDVLAEVTDAIESEGHIWPKIYTLREFDYLKEDYAPGVKKLRDKRDESLSAKKTRTVTRSTMNTLLKVGMKDYRVLIVKSSSAYPYSSVFMELDSGYWNGNSEDALRRGMRNKKSSSTR